MGRISRDRYDQESQNFVYTYIHTDPANNHTGFDVTGHFRSQVIAKKTVEMPIPTSVGRNFRERFKRGSQNFARLSGTTSLRNLPDMISQVASGRLQNAIEYCAKVHITGAAGKQSNNSTTL